MYSLEDYQYDLPAALIAQVPTQRRDDSRMMVLDRAGGHLTHSRISALEEYLDPGDLLVVNDTRVVPARLLGRKESGGRVEVLVLHPGTEDGPYRCLLKGSRVPKPGTLLEFDGGIKARVCGLLEEGQAWVEFMESRPLLEVLEKVGRVPLPPYIRQNGGGRDVDDRQAYQTVYADRPGAVAAPTAGLHFSESLLDKLNHKGVVLASLTLHVGFGTFQPVRHADIRKHRLHEEYFELPAETAAAVNQAKQEGRRVVAVGTTSVRALEFTWSGGRVHPGSGWCDLMIYPGFRFQVIDALLTNFHLPGSSLIMLVSAWFGRVQLLQAYKEAIEMGYRFYSYGDAMLIK
jgi:S-adenosylmethionine:tRNA ribosyltransferase-isomerase